MNRAGPSDETEKPRERERQREKKERRRNKGQKKNKVRGGESERKRNGGDSEKRRPRKAARHYPLIHHPPRSGEMFRVFGRDPRRTVVGKEKDGKAIYTKRKRKQASFAKRTCDTAKRKGGVMRM